MSGYDNFLVDAIGAGADVTGLGEAYTVMEDCIGILHQPEDSVTATVTIRNADGTPRTPAPAFQRLMSLLSRSTPSVPFELEVLQGDYELLEDGSLVITGDAVLNITALEANRDAVVHIEYDNGYVIDYGSAIKVCETCGQLINAKYVNPNATAMLADGSSYQDVRGAIQKAAETCEPTIMTLFGNINITTNVTIPDFITVILAPGTNITVKNGCSFVAVVKDFSERENDLRVNILLNYWEGRTELMQVPAGTVVNSLPDIGTETCPLLGWYADDAHDEVFEPFTAGAEAGAHIYYADIHHDFNDHGKCKLCGELHNGRDAFTGASVSISGEVKLNLKAKLSPAAFADKNAVIRFEFEDGTVQNVKMTQARSNGDGTYTFTCKIDPIKMSDNVRAQILYSDGVRGTVLDYSLRTYFQNVLRKTNLDPKMANLIKALVNYGGYLQKFNGEPEEKLINNLIRCSQNRDI